MCIYPWKISLNDNKDKSGGGKHRCADQEGTDHACTDDEDTDQTGTNGHIAEEIHIWMPLIGKLR